MNELPPEDTLPREVGLERIQEELPKKAEVMSVIESVVSKLEVGLLRDTGTETREIPISKTESDEQGLYLLEANICRESGELDAQYIYTRKGEYPDGIARLSTGIDVVYYDEGGIPCGGTNVAEYRAGVWIEI